MLEAFINYAIELVLLTLTTILSVVIIPKLSAWLKSKTENETMQMIITELMQTTKTSVEFMEQAVVRQLKADGKWNGESQKDVLKATVDEVIGSLTDITKSTIQKDNIDLHNVVVRYVESYIQSKKNGGNYE